MDQKVLDKFADQFIVKFITAKTDEQRIEVLGQAIAFADKLDTKGLGKSAEQMDELIKNAGFLDNFLTGGGLSGGYETLKGLWSGELFTAAGIKKVLATALEAGGSYAISNALLSAIAEHVPGLGFIFKSESVNKVFSAAITYALMQSNFLDTLGEMIASKLKQLWGAAWGSKSEPAKTAPTTAPAALPPAGDNKILPLQKSPQAVKPWE